MQKLGSIGGGGDRFFSDGGELRLRPHHQQPNDHLTLKCPRCDSLHTKFCYFNNYNLSQPRHYCKSCRRYWTKGGVLRNVPIGGGCRKSKRSNPKTTASDSQLDLKCNSHCSSESSSLIASTTAATSSKTTTAAVTMDSTTAAITPDVASPDPTLHKFPDWRLFNIPQTPNQNFDPPPLIDQSSDGGIFPQFGIFTSMMSFCQDPSLLAFNIADDSSPAYRQLDQNNGTVPQKNQSSNQQNIANGATDALKMKEIAAGFQNPTAQVELSGLVHQKTNNVGVGALDWQAGDDQFMYDLPIPVDQTYWNQTQWIDDEHPL